jgi:hypothetical protein
MLPGEWRKEHDGTGNFKKVLERYAIIHDQGEVNNIDDVLLPRIL